MLTELRPANWSAEDAVRYEVGLEGAAQVIGFCAAADMLAKGSWRRLQETWALRRRELTPYAVDEIAAIHSDGEDLLAEELPPGQVERVFDSSRAFRERIVPNELTGTPQRHPVAVIVAGSAAATVSALVQELLSRRGRPVIVGPERFEPYHPDFWHPISEPPCPSPDGRQWTDDAVDHVREQRFDVVLEQQDFDRSARRFKDAGYRVEVAVVAAAEATERFAALDRHLRALEAYGCGRLAEPTTPAADHDQYADLFAVLRPNGELLYGVQRSANGSWPRRPEVAAAIAAEHERPWTVPESRRFLEAVAAYERRGLSAPVPWVRQEAIEGARAVTALARPRLHPDAVTLHIATAGISP